MTKCKLETVAARMPADAAAIRVNGLRLEEVCSSYIFFQDNSLQQDGLQFRQTLLLISMMPVRDKNVTEVVPSPFSAVFLAVCTIFSHVLLSSEDDTTSTSSKGFLTNVLTV